MPRSAAVPYIARKALLLRLYLKSQPKVSTKRGKRVTTYFTYGIPLQSSASLRAWTQTLYACGPCSSWLANSAGTNLLSPVALPTWDVRDARARQGGRGLCPTLATDDPLCCTGHRVAYSLVRRDRLLIHAALTRICGETWTEARMMCLGCWIKRPQISRQEAVMIH